MIAALAGVNVRSWKSARSARENAATDFSVPMRGSSVAVIPAVEGGSRTRWTRSPSARRAAGGARSVGPCGRVRAPRPERSAAARRPRRSEAPPRTSAASRGAHGGQVPARSGVEVDAQVVDLVRDLERARRSGALVEHVRGQAREPRLVPRVRCRSRAGDDVQLNDRHLVLLHEQDRDAVRETRASARAGSFSARTGPERRRLRAVGLRDGSRAGVWAGSGWARRSARRTRRGTSHALHGFFSAASDFLPVGTTESTRRASSLQIARGPRTAGRRESSDV